MTDPPEADPAPPSPVSASPDVVDLAAYRRPAKTDDEGEQTPEIERLRKQIDYNMGMMLGSSKTAWLAFDRLQELGAKL